MTTSAASIASSSTASSINSLDAFIDYMQSKGAIVSTCDVSGICIPEIYEEGVINAPEWATLTAVFSRCPETGQADISVWAHLYTGEEYYASRGRPAHVLLHCLQRFGGREVSDWVEAQIEWYRADIDRLNREECPEGYYVDRSVDCIGLEWLSYHPFGSTRGQTKSCPYQYWLLR